MPGIKRMSDVMWAVESSTVPGKQHVVRLEAAGYTCDCPGYQIKHTCKHIRRVSNELMVTGRRLNEHLVVFTRNTAVGMELPEEGDVSLLIHGSVQAVENVNRDDGTYDRLYKIRVLTIDEPDDE